MINWIKKFFVTEEKTKHKPKCVSCGLNASMYMLMEFQTLELTELEEKIIVKICGSCYNEIYERYNPNWLPPPIQAKVFE